MIEQSREEIAGMLLGAYTSRQPVEPLTEKYDDLTLEDAYEIQLLQVRRWLSAGARIKGHKVGLTSAAMQRQLGVHQPDYGHLLPPCRRSAPVEGAGTQADPDADTSLVEPPPVHLEGPQPVPDERIAGGDFPGCFLAVGPDNRHP